MSVYNAVFFFCKQKTAYEMRISDWSSDVCSSDLHWTKDLALSPDGRTLYASVGSNSNAAERGLEAEKGRAAIWQVDRETGAARVYASGLRNPNGLNFHPETGELWTVVNERAELGPNLAIGSTAGRGRVCQNE